MKRVANLVVTALAIIGLIGMVYGALVQVKKHYATTCVSEDDDPDNYGFSFHLNKTTWRL